MPTADDFQKVSLLYSSGNPNDRELANQLVHYIKSHPRSYQIALQIYNSYLDTKLPEIFDWTKFFCLQIINDYVESTYNRIPTEELSCIKSFLNSWLRHEVKCHISNILFVYKQIEKINKLLYTNVIICILKTKHTKLYLYFCFCCFKYFSI